MSFASLDDLRSQLGGAPKQSPEYIAKMLHALPAAKQVDREAFILKHCTGKRVLEFGASGPLHEQIVNVAAWCWGFDRADADRVEGFDLDDVSQTGLPHVASADIIVCGEVLEHLGNPLWFLTRLHRQFAGVPVIITVPNAFSIVQQRWIAKGLENVNADHVCWYSPKTLSVLLERAGYQVGALYYYNGSDATAEGLIVATE